MRILLNEDQLMNILIEQNIFYGDDQLPGLMEEIKKDVTDGSNLCVKFFGMLKSLNIGDIMDNSSKYVDYIEKMKKVHNVIYKKSNKYNDILNSFEYDFDNQTLMDFEKLCTSFYTIQDDMDNIINDFSNIIETVLEYDGSIKNKYGYLNKEYPSKTIEI
jgi:hypothetical protein